MDLESKIKKSNLGVKVNAVSGVMKCIAAVATFPALYYAKKYDIPAPIAVAGMLSIPYFLLTGVMDLSLSYRKYKNYKNGTAEFKDYSENPSKITSASKEIIDAFAFVAQREMD